MIKLIAACDPYGGIGYKGKIPWHVPEDMKLFKLMTTGHTVVMGRKTYESIGKTLPSRKNVVITKTIPFSYVGTPYGDLTVTQNIDWAVRHDKDNPNETIWIIGGAEIYNYYLQNKLVDEVYLTIVNSEEICDSRIQIDLIHRFYTEDPVYKVEFLSHKENRMCCIQRYTRKPEI